MCAIAFYIGSVIIMLRKWVPKSSLEGTPFLKADGSDWSDWTGSDKLSRPAPLALISAAVALFLLAIEVLVRKRTWRFWKLILPVLIEAQGNAGLCGLLQHFAGIIFVFLALFSILSVPLLVEIMLVVQDQEIHHVCVVLASLFAILASALSFQEIYRHLTNYSMSRVQKRESRAVVSGHRCIPNSFSSICVSLIWNVALPRMV